MSKKLKIKQIIIQIGFASSNGDFKRNFLNSAYKINNTLIKDENQELTESDFENNTLKISYGKKKHHLIKLS